MAVALITGGNSGIGQATAMLFAQRGYQVAIAARRSQPLEQARTAIAQAGGTVMSVTANVSVAAEVNQMVEAVMKAWGQIDTLIHAAGIAHEGTILDTTEAQWDETINTNLKGTYLVNQAVLKRMVDRGQGSIVNVASDAGLTGGRNLAAYCASKGGVVLLTKAMALDHARQGVRVNALCPGPVDTPMTAAMSEEEMAHWKAMLPIQRFASAAEVAEAAYFLAHAAYATGSCLSIDGGNTAGGSI
ncbi:MAG: SDR family oxidoreductase [Oscillatoriophycideae cyanobacterium NC_groundwater_1537_Pr4_S-0.65um_50_18]|nr:SDR family oxidoreductase [Oscillatoriophycideae cyanobacterium NC_groundwater_1537_Pr4_S-0.65um_50_18]